MQMTIYIINSNGLHDVEGAGSILVHHQKDVVPNETMWAIVIVMK